MNTIAAISHQRAYVSHFMTAILDLFITSSLAEKTGRCREVILAECQLGTRYSGRYRCREV